MLRRWLRRLWIGLAFSLAVGLADSLWYYLMLAVKGAPPAWFPLLRSYLPYWILTAILTPPIVSLARATPLDRQHRARAILTHLLAAIVFTVIHVVAFQLYTSLFGKGDFASAPFLSMIPKMIATSFDRELLLYLVLAGAVYGFDYYERFRERARAAAQLALERERLRASLSEAKLEALQVQLQPHFLFNTLHAISTLVMKGETQAAHSMLVHLSDLLRMTLDRANDPTVPLADELDLLEAYVRIQQTRFGERIRVNSEIAPSSRTLPVPPMVLQPLVENAIQHGIGANSGAGNIWISTRVQDDRLVLTVENDGATPAPAALRSEGVGLSNVRARLEQLYPGCHAFTIEPRAGCGTRAEIRLPCVRKQSEEDAQAASTRDGSDPNADRG